MWHGLMGQAAWVWRVLRWKFDVGVLSTPDLVLRPPFTSQDGHGAATDNVVRAIGDALTNVPLIHGASCSSNGLPSSGAPFGGQRPVASTGPASLAALQFELDRGVAALQVSCAGDVGAADGRMTRAILSIQPAFPRLMNRRTEVHGMFCCRSWRPAPGPCIRALLRGFMGTARTSSHLLVPPMRLRNL